MNDSHTSLDDTPQPDHEPDRGGGVQSQKFASQGKKWMQDLVRSYVYLTRLPLIHAQEDLPSGPISESMRGFPVVGALIGAMGGIAFLLSDLIGFTPLLSASIAMLVLSGLTGVIHEQALAQVMSTKDTPSSSMKGFVYVTFAVLIKVACLTQIGAQAWGAPLTVLILIAAASTSRAAMVGAAYFLHNKHDENADDHAGLRSGELYQVPQAQLAQAMAVSGIIVLLCLVLSQGFSIFIAAIIGAALASGVVIKMANQENGRPADRLGAVQQVSELAFLLVTTALLAT